MKQSRNFLLGLILALAFAGSSRSMEPEDLVMYPEYVFYNGKIVTVDNSDFTRNLGTIAQALAVRGGKVLAVGSTDEIRALVGPQTKSIDRLRE